MIEQYYNKQGGNVYTGIPTPERLVELVLMNVI